MTLSSRDTRVLVAGVGVVFAILLVGRALPALARLTDERRQRAALALSEVERIASSRRNAARTRKALARLRPQLAAWDSALVVEGEPGTASARLAELLGEGAESAEARLGAVQLSADTVAIGGALMRARVRANVTGDLMSIALFIESIEAGPPLVAVRELSIAPSQAGTVPGQSETLQAEVWVEGLFRRAAVSR